MGTFWWGSLPLSLRLMAVFFVFLTNCVRKPAGDEKAIEDPVYAAIQASREVIIATDPTVYPLNLEGLDSQEGFEVILADFIAKDLSDTFKAPVKVKWLVVNFDTIKDAVASNNAHLGMNGLFPAENNIEGDWGVYSDPYYTTALTIAHRSSLGKQTLSSVQQSGKPVAIFADPAAVDTMKQNKLKYLSFNVAEGHTAALISGQVMYAAYDYPLLVELTKHNKGISLMEGIIPGTEASYAVLVPKSSKNLLESVNRGIKSFQGDQATQDKYKSYLIPKVQ